jgi:hypothetical protein
VSLLEASVAVWLGGGLLVFCGWVVRVYVTQELPPRPDLTAQLVWYGGRAVIWIAALLLAGGLLGTALATVWRLVRG